MDFWIRFRASKHTLLEIFTQEIFMNSRILHSIMTNGSPRKRHEVLWMFPGWLALPWHGKENRFSFFFMHINCRQYCWSAICWKWHDTYEYFITVFYYHAGKLTIMAVSEYTRRTQLLQQCCNSILSWTVRCKVVWDSRQVWKYCISIHFCKLIISWIMSISTPSCLPMQ